MVLLLAASPVKANDDHIEEAGDILQYAIPATAYGLTFHFHDRKGRHQLYKSLLTNLAITGVIKTSMHKLRPNGGDHSFPSGHTSAAFSGASFIQHRYGWKYGIPAYIGASFVGFSRVESFNHFPSDVMAGAAIGIISSCLFTKPYNQHIQLMPMVRDGEYCLALNYKW